MLAQIKGMTRGTFLRQSIKLGITLIQVLIIWHSLKFFTGTSSPIMAVLSSSMEPTFHRGDLIFVMHHEGPFKVDEIVVYKVTDKDIPIVHRIIEIKQEDNGNVKILTRGDNNDKNDRELYGPGQLWLSQDAIQGRVKGSLPYLGMVAILMNDYPWLKFGLLGRAGLFDLLL